MEDTATTVQEVQEQAVFIEELKSLSNDDLFDMCKKVIALQIEHSDEENSEWHWKSDFCFRECSERERLSIYARAYESVGKGEGK